MFYYYPIDLISDAGKKIKIDQITKYAAHNWGNGESEMLPPIITDANDDEKDRCLEELTLFLKQLKAICRTAVISQMIRYATKYNMRRQDGQDFGTWKEVKEMFEKQKKTVKFLEYRREKQIMLLENMH